MIDENEVIRCSLAEAERLIAERDERISQLEQILEIRTHYHTLEVVAIYGCFIAVAIVKWWL